MSKLLEQYIQKDISNLLKKFKKLSKEELIKEYSFLNKNISDTKILSQIKNLYNESLINIEKNSTIKKNISIIGFDFSDSNLKTVLTWKKPELYEYQKNLYGNITKSPTIEKFQFLYKTFKNKNDFWSFIVTKKNFPIAEFVDFYLKEDINEKNFFIISLIQKNMLKNFNIKVLGNHKIETKSQTALYLNYNNYFNIINFNNDHIANSEDKNFLILTIYQYLNNVSNKDIKKYINFFDKYAQINYQNDLKTFLNSIKSKQFILYADACKAIIEQIQLSEILDNNKITLKSKTTNKI